MADGRFVYEVTIDGATAQQAARRLRDVFEKELAQAGESAANVSVRQTADRAALQAIKQAEREKVNAAREAAREQAALAREAAKESAQAAREAAAAVKRADQDETSSAGAAARSRAIAAKMAADEAAAAARAAAAAVRRADEEGAASARAAAQERAAAARQAADQTIAAAKEAARAQEAAQQQARGGRTLGGTLRSIDNLLMFGVGGLAGYGAVQAGQQLYGAGRAGAGMERTTLALEQSARDLNVSAQAMVRAIQEGSRGTVAQSEAQSMSLQLLSQKWASQRPDIAGDAQLIAQAARLFSQRYVTAEGQPMSSSEVVGRLLGYIREGNKELIDQFGFNNAMVAKAAGVENENLTAEDRARGLFTLLGEEVTRLADVTDTNMERIQRAEAQFTDAMDRIKIAMAGPVANSATFVADILGNVTGNGPARDLAATRDTVQVYRGPKPEEAPANATQQAAEQYLDVAERYDKAVAQNAQAAMAFTDELNRLGQALVNQGNLTGDQYTQLNQLAIRLRLVTEGTDAYSVTMSRVTEAGVSQNTELLAIARAMAAYEELLVSGQITMDQYTFGLGKLAEHLGVVATAAGLAATGIDAVNGAARSKPGSGIVWPDSLGGGQGAALFPRAGDPARTRAIRQGDWRDPAAGRTGVDPLTGALTGAGSKGDRSRAADPWDTFQQEVTDAQEQAAQAAQRDWESAANKTQKAFEQAAEDAAQAFKSNLEKIPGLFGTSDVTAQDMEDAKAGIYREKPDEYLRQLRDEVLNKKDYPGVDLADIARVAGVDQSLAPEAQLRLIERKWSDSSLFANPEALRFINKDAVDAFQADQAASAAGRTNLLSLFGLGADSPLAPAEKDAFAQMIGLDDPTEIQAAARTAKETFAAEFAKPATEGGANSGAAFVQELVGSLDADLIGGDVLKTLNGVGEGILGAIKAGYDKAASEGDWSTPVVTSLAEQVLPMVLQAVEDNL